tara:strand:+ start:404 stop:646 length:243 start_codon:yes stop_codon:yes gene_type:complete
MSEAAYVVFISLKEEGKVNDHPLAPLDTEIEARAYRDGYVDAIVNHTDKADRAEVFGLFGIKRVGEELINNNKQKGDEDA